jgi:membrane fusion protein (multidrug efflux system)
MSTTQKHPPVKNHKRDPLLNTVLTVLAWLLVSAGIIGGVWFLLFSSKHEETNDAQVDQYVTPVAARVSGFIREVRYEENQYVHKGDTLVIIDDREYILHLKKALADMANAERNVAVTQKGRQAVASNVAVKDAQLESAKVEVWRTEQEYKRYKNLLEDQAATEQQFEHAKAQYDEAVAKYDEMKRQISSASLSAGEAESKIGSAEATIDLKKTEADNAALYLSYTVVTAPYDGWVGRKVVQNGQLIKEGQTLVSVVSREKWITANFKETQLHHLQVGKEVEITVDAYDRKTFRGKITSFSPASGSRFSLLPPDNSTGNFVKIEQRVPVRIDFLANEDISMLRAGMNAEVTATNK